MVNELVCKMGSNEVAAARVVPEVAKADQVAKAVVGGGLSSKQALARRALPNPVGRLFVVTRLARLDAKHFIIETRRQRLIVANDVD